MSFIRDRKCVLVKNGERKYRSIGNGKMYHRKDIKDSRMEFIRDSKRWEQFKNEEKFTEINKRCKVTFFWLSELYSY